MYFAILEDNYERRQAMADAFVLLQSPLNIVFFTSSQAMRTWLPAHLTQISIISLDHDLDFEPDETGKLVDAGTGRDVSDLLCDHQAVCPVIIHSTNVIAAQAMESTLTEVGWEVDRLTPYEDLLWVTEAWLPIVKRRLKQHAKR